jgi:SAM-dependent methyltransferase
MTDQSLDNEDVLWDLESLARARRLADWMFAQFAADAKGTVAEVGAGIGTFSARLLNEEVESLLLIEPEERCADALVKRFAGEPRVTVVREKLPNVAALLERPRTFDFVLCQNVLEHVHDDYAAAEVMASCMRPGGRIGILVPAGPRLFGSLDRRYGHERRYTRSRLRDVLERAQLNVADLYSFNALGIPGWVVKSRTGAASLGTRSLAAYEMLLPLWRPIEDRLRLPWGLSLVAHGERP